MAEVLRELRNTERCRIHCHYGNSRDSREFLSIRWGTKIIFDSGLNLPEQLIAQIAFVYCRIEYELDRSNRHAILLQTRGPFLESPVNFSGPKSNIQIEIKRIRARVLASKLLHFVSLTDSFIMLDAKLLKPRSLV